MSESERSESPVAIGIDLGTTTSCISACVDGKAEVLLNDDGEGITPSVVAFTSDGTAVVGKLAKAYLSEDPKSTIFSGKRLIGRDFFSQEVRKAKMVCLYDIVAGQNGDVRVEARGDSYSLSEISAMILSEMKGVAEARLGRPVNQAVITVPAYFNDIQRQATKDAGRIAGLEVLRIINEPTAAALAYGYGNEMNKKVAIYDLGGGTFDISILEIGDDVFEVLSTAGDTFLGGDDFDDRLLDRLADSFVAEHGINPRRDIFALQKLKTAAEKAKISLSESDVAIIEIPDLIEVDGEKKGISSTLTRADFVLLTQDLVQRTLAVCESALQSAGLLATDLDGVMLVGGPTRLPIIRDAVEDFFKKPPQFHLDPEEVVAKGAAIHAASLMETSNQTFLLDVTPLSLRLGISGGLTETIIESNSPIPIEQTRAFTTLKDNQERVIIRIYQGENRIAEENQLLGEFEFGPLRAAPRGALKIDITFEINSEGLVEVTAKDQETGKEHATTVRLTTGLTEEEIQRATKAHAEKKEAANNAQDANERGLDLADTDLVPAEAQSAEKEEEPDIGSIDIEDELAEEDDEQELQPLGPDEELTSELPELDLMDGVEPALDDEKDDDDPI